MAIIIAVEDQTVRPGDGTLFEFTLKRKTRITHYIHYVSSTCETGLFMGTEPIIPADGYIRVYNVVVVLELPEDEDLIFDRGTKLTVRYNNKTSGNVRVIAGFVGKTVA